MSEAGWSLQKAIYSTLIADATLKTLIGDPFRARRCADRGSRLRAHFFARDIQRHHSSARRRRLSGRHPLPRRHGESVMAAGRRKIQSIPARRLI